MTALQELEVNYSLFLNRTTIIYGKSGTGKSTIIADILYSLRPHAEQIIVIAPTDPTNHTYDRGLVPLPCIHYNITDKLLDAFWERQEAMVGRYYEANKPEVLQSLFDRCPTAGKMRSVIDEIKRKMRDCEAEINDMIIGEGEKETKIKRMREKYEEFIIMIMRKVINENCSQLARANLSEKESLSLKYLNINPNIVLIFDDCTEQLDKFKKHPVMQRIFFAGRHNRITAIVAAHTDKSLDSAIKGNCFVTMFTEPASANIYYFGRTTMGFDKDAKNAAANAIKCAFTPAARHQKLVHTRMDDKFYRYTATIHGTFRFGNPSIWEFCERIKTGGGGVPATNRFANDFL